MSSRSSFPNESFLSSRKSPGKGKAQVVHNNVEVFIRVSYNRILNIDLRDQKFTVEFRLEAQWQSVEDGLYEHAKNGEKPHYSASKEGKTDEFNFANEPERKYFTPRLKYANLVKFDTDPEAWLTVGTVDKNGNERKDKEDRNVCFCKFRTVGVAVFATDFELADFPSDVQMLKIIVQSDFEYPKMIPPVKDYEDYRPFRFAPKQPWNNTNDLFDQTRVVLIENVDSDYRSFCNDNAEMFSQSKEYQLYSSINFSTRKTRKSESASSREYAQLVVAAAVRRKLNYWKANVVLPLALITSAVCTTFSIDTDDVGTRCEITLTLTLTLVAYIFMLNDKLPAINYLTIIDKYMLYMILPLNTILIITFAFSAAYIRTTGETIFFEPNQEPLWTTVGFLVGWTLVHILFWSVLRAVQLKNIEHVRSKDRGNSFFYMRGLNIYKEEKLKKHLKKIEEENKKIEEENFKNHSTKTKIEDLSQYLDEEYSKRYEKDKIKMLRKAEFLEGKLVEILNDKLIEDIEKMIEFCDFSREDLHEAIADHHKKQRADNARRVINWLAWFPADDSVEFLTGSDENHTATQDRVSSGGDGSRQSHHSDRSSVDTENGDKDEEVTSVGSERSQKMENPKWWPDLKDLLKIKNAYHWFGLQAKKAWHVEKEGLYMKHKKAFNEYPGNKKVDFTVIEFEHQQGAILFARIMKDFLLQVAFYTNDSPEQIHAVEQEDDDDEENPSARSGGEIKRRSATLKAQHEPLPVLETFLRDVSNKDCTDYRNICCEKMSSDWVSIFGDTQIYKNFKDEDVPHEHDVDNHPNLNRSTSVDSRNYMEEQEGLLENTQPDKCTIRSQSNP